MSVKTGVREERAVDCVRAWGPGDSEADRIVTWDDFTQSTTFHGVRYIFQRNHFRLRRYVQLLLQY